MKHTVDMFLLADYSLSDKMISYVSFLILVIKKVIWSLPLKINHMFSKHWVGKCPTSPTASTCSALIGMYTFFNRNRCPLFSSTLPFCQLHKGWLNSWVIELWIFMKIRTGILPGILLWIKNAFSWNRFKP